VSEHWTSEVSADQPAERGQGVDVAEQADVAVDTDDAAVEETQADDALVGLPKREAPRSSMSALRTRWMQAAEGRSGR